MIVDDGALVAVDLAVGHAVDGEVRAEKVAGLPKNARRIGKRANRVLQAAEERLPIFSALQRLPGARPFAGRPGAIRRHLDERDLIATPAARPVAVNGERGNPSTFFDQRHTNEGLGSVREELCTIRSREPRVRMDIGDDDRLAAKAFVGDGFAELRQGPAAGKRCDGPPIRLADINSLPSICA